MKECFSVDYVAFTVFVFMHLMFFISKINLRKGGIEGFLHGSLLMLISAHQLQKSSLLVTEKKHLLSWILQV